MKNGSGRDRSQTRSDKSARGNIKHEACHGECFVDGSQPFNCHSTQKMTVSLTVSNLKFKTYIDRIGDMTNARALRKQYKPELYVHRYAQICAISRRFRSNCRVRQSMHQRRCFPSLFRTEVLPNRDGGILPREVMAVPDTSISGVRVARELTMLIARRGKPGMIVSDNGTELTDPVPKTAPFGKRAPALLTLSRKLRHLERELRRF